MRSWAAILCAGTFCGLCMLSFGCKAAAEPNALARIEARSSSFLAVGVVRDDTMNVHVSRLLDNSPVRDAVVTVSLRGTAHPTSAQIDGSYSFQAKELRLPGSASFEIRVAQGVAQEKMSGALKIAGNSDNAPKKNTARQLWWWVLNFAVCIGFMMLISRRRKATQNS